QGTNDVCRLDSGKRGSSVLTRPVSRRPAACCEYEPEEVEVLVLKLSKEGNSPSLIGQILRDKYGIPLVSQVVGRRLEHIIPEESRKKLHEDMEKLLRQETSDIRYLEKNRTDSTTDYILSLCIDYT